MHGRIEGETIEFQQVSVEISAAITKITNTIISGDIPAGFCKWLPKENPDNIPVGIHVVIP